jgi:hypothetical protein
MGAMLSRAALSTITRTMIAGTSMSMMVLGGDPQTALNAMIMVAAIWAANAVKGKQEAVPWRVMIAAPILAAALAAPQIAASASWSNQSDRVRDADTQRWVDPPEVGGKRYGAFQYSLAPWHTLELATPNAFGSLLPINRRLSRLIPGDGRTWTPSIYMGTLVLLALLSRLRGWRSTGPDPWLAMALVSLWLAMGHFGVAWLVQSLTGGMPHVDSAIGGPYWWLYQFFPGYDAFRYPAKWLTLFSLAAAMVAAQGVEHGFCSAGKTLLRIPVGLGVGFIVGFAGTVLLRWNPGIVWDPSVQRSSDEFWGPLDIDGALAQISHSLLHSAIALMAIAAVFRLRRSRMWSDQTVQRCLLAIVLIDVGCCGYGWTARVPRGTEHDLIAKLDVANAPSGLRWMRMQSGGGWPSSWKETKDDARLVDVEASVRAAWFGRWHLADRAGVLNNMVSIRSHDMALFWKATRQATSGMSPEEREAFWWSMRRWLAIDGVVHATDQSIAVPIDDRLARLVDCKRRVERGEPDAPRGQTLRAHSQWTHREWREVTAEDFAQRLRTLAKSHGLAAPVVEAIENLNVRPGSDGSDAIIRAGNRRPDEAEFDVELKAPALLTRPVYQDGHWIAQCAPSNSMRWQRVKVHRVDYLTQGVLLPAGHWKLRFRYAPVWLPWSLAVAALSWIAVIVVLVRTRTGWRANVPGVPVPTVDVSSPDHPVR